jgi:hypothetical protein
MARQKWLRFILVPKPIGWSIWDGIGKLPKVLSSFPGLPLTSRIISLRTICLTLVVQK